MESHKIIQVEEKVPLKLLLPLSIQHMFAMFGASVLVPFIFGINPAIVLFMNGVGTLLFIVVTKAKSPAYLGSSFASLAPAGVVISKMGYPYALGGFVASAAYMLQMPIFIIIVGFIYLVEVLSVMIQVTYFKKTGGKRIFKMAPIHHHFELCGWSETRVVAVFSIITAILCLIALMAM